MRPKLNTIPFFNVLYINQKCKVYIARKLLVFESDFAQIRSESLISQFHTEQQEQFAHICSFVKSNNIDLLTSLFFKE